MNSIKNEFTEIWHCCSLTDSNNWLSKLLLLCNKAEKALESTCSTQTTIIYPNVPCSKPIRLIMWILWPHLAFTSPQKKIKSARRLHFFGLYCGLAWLILFGKLLGGIAQSMMGNTCRKLIVFSFTQTTTEILPTPNRTNHHMLSCHCLILIFNLDTYGG